MRGSYRCNQASARSLTVEQGCGSIGAMPTSRLAGAWWLLGLGACASTAPAPVAAPVASSDAVVAPAVAGEVAVGGAVPRAARLRTADLEALGAEDVLWTFRDQAHTYRGVGLDKVLAHCGFDAGP